MSINFSPVYLFGLVLLCSPKESIKDFNKKAYDFLQFTWVTPKAGTFVQHTINLSNETISINCSSDLYISLL
jgi:hypothetical protein